MRSHFSLCRTAITLLAASLASGCASSLPLARLEPVTIHARGDAGEIDAIAASIDAALADIAGRLDLSIPSRSLDVYLFDTTWGMRNYLREHCPERTGKAAACFSRPGGFTITVVKSSQPSKTERALRHELTHYLLASHYRDVPRWIDEGLAQYVETIAPEHRDDKRREFRKRKIPRTETAFRELVFLPARQSLDPDQYLLSWAMVSFLMEEDGFGLSHIKSYLAQIVTCGNAQSCFEANFDSVAKLIPLWESFLVREGLVRIAASGLELHKPTSAHNMGNLC